MDIQHTQLHKFNVCNLYFFFFDNLGCPGQRFVDTHTLTNPRGIRNILLARVPR